jgi:hypothetical protein
MTTAYFLRLTFIASIAVVLFTSCKKEKALDNSSPAYQIAESEKLIIPATIDFPANAGGHTRVATLYAEGVQKYKAQVKAGSTPVTYEWVFVAPQADLYDANNKKVGTHGAGPYWTLSAADSVFAQAFTPAKTSPSDEAATIDWLLLMTKQGKTPTGLFANVDYIQRIATKGGKAPATSPVSAAETINVPYTAIYRFTRKNP